MEFVSVSVISGGSSGMGLTPPNKVLDAPLNMCIVLVCVSNKHIVKISSYLGVKKKFTPVRFWKNKLKVGI